jgi:hypothetical protein
MAISLYPADWPFAIFKVLTGEHRGPVVVSFHPIEFAWEESV